MYIESTAVNLLFGQNFKVEQTAKSLFRTFSAREDHRFRGGGINENECPRKSQTKKSHARKRGKSVSKCKNYKQSSRPRRQISQKPGSFD
jgi:hypothetical protein